ncbi:MAG: hypothetical protein REI94_03060 [Moraxellaceae bacterium]|nr:hypothetical protein [Moraxellaceae bacterium]
MMDNRFLLYIDILGFSDLVSDSPRRIDDLYEVIASLNAHKHDAFRCVIFSDTILVYNVDGGDTRRDISYLLMFQCEFVKDLLHRLTNRGIFYRAVITSGYFRHYQLNDVPCFYGTALIDAYNAEKDIKAIGLFMDNRLLRFCDIFHHTPFNDSYSFVYVTQALDQLEGVCGCKLPAGEIKMYIEQTELNWNGGPEVLHLAELCRNARSHELPESVAKKYQTTVEIYRRRYPHIVSRLEDNQFDIKFAFPEVDWSAVISRHPESCAYAIEERNEF